MKIAYLTAGAAGMYCGSCMHDNTLASALNGLGVDVQLIPCYTPIRTDETDVSVDQVFFGGVNVYLQQRIPLFRHLPRLLDRVLDRPRFLRWATSRAAAVDPRLLGELTVSMLRGEHGNQRKEVRRLDDYLTRSHQPDLIVFTNLLIGGCIPELKRSLGRPVLVTLQGDDIFLDSLREPYRAQALAEIHRLVPSVDGFLVHSQSYADRMQAYFDLPRERIRIVPLGIDTRHFTKAATTSRPGSEMAIDDRAGSRSIGYLARLAPEKGLHLLVDAFLQVRQDPQMQDVRLEIAGWLGDHQRDYAQTAFNRLRDQGLSDAFSYHGTVDLDAKIRFLQGRDVFCVPTTYQEPKGLYVLEALAAGTPVVAPNHGAFPELLRETGGGVLSEPGDPGSLAAALTDLLGDPERRARLGETGRQAVFAKRNARTMAEATLAVFADYSGREA